jgi:DNA-binding transcriptional ArsR family regulator
MKTKTDNPFDALEKIFHEPNRLAIMSALCAADGGVPFTDLKAACRLTDGNLSRHLKALAQTGLIGMEKAFVELRPRTTVHLTKTGYQRFNEYLAALTEVLEQARQAAGAESRKTRLPAIAKTVPA